VLRGCGSRIHEDEQEYAKRVVYWAKRKYSVRQLAELTKIARVTINNWYNWGGIPGKENWPILKAFYEKERADEVRQSNGAV
jgi:hypothetical protein